jgi:hypothetical protein
MGADTGPAVALEYEPDDLYVEDRFRYETELDAAETHWASLSAQEQAAALNWQTDMMDTNDPPPCWVAVAGRLVEEGSDEHHRLARSVALASRRSQLVGVVRPLIRVRDRGRGRRGRRSSAGSRARSPGRQDDDEPDRLDDLEAAA